MTKIVDGSSENEILYYFEIIARNHSIYTMNHPKFSVSNQKEESITVLSTKSDSGAILCLHINVYTLLERESHYHFCVNPIHIDHLCINPILWIGLIHKRSIDPKSLISL